MDRLQPATALLLVIALLVACNTARTDQLMIATAANAQFAIQEVASAFTEESDIPCEIVVSSSGKLTAQIRQGAPYDLFVSADLKYPNDLHQGGFTAGQPEIYAYGQLVLWTLHDTLPSPEIFTTDQVRHIAIANPRTAPYGAAAVEVLQYYDLYSEVEDKLIFGESIAQTNQFITTRGAEVGITAKSVVLSDHMRQVGSWADVEPQAYTRIAQSAVVIRNGRNRAVDAEKFLTYLLSSEGREILRTYGYQLSSL